MSGATSPASNETTQPSNHSAFATQPWWMIVLLELLPVFCGFALTCIYAWHFPRGLSDRQEVWGQFGDFVGGALNPIIALMTLIAVAASLRYTVYALRESAKATALAYKQFENDVREQGNRRLEERDAQKKARTFQLHRIWISSEMQARRITALDYLRRLAFRSDCSGNSAIIYVGDSRESGGPGDRMTYDSVRAIWEFMADINTLARLGMLDDRLVLELFKMSMAPWVAMNNRVDLRRHASDNSPESLRENAWFRDRVRTLGGVLELPQEGPASDTRETPNSREDPDNEEFWKSMVSE